MFKELKSYYVIIPLFLLCAFYTYKAHFFVIHDFANYYFGAYFLKLGSFTTDIYFPHHFNIEIAALGYQNIFVSYAPNTPFLALFFLPFTLLSLKTAKLVFAIISTFLFLYSVKRLLSEYKIAPVYVLIIPLLFFVPIKNNFLFGQVYLLLFFLLSEGFLAYKKEAYVKMGIFWGLAILLKVFPVILVALLLFKKEFRALVYLSVTCLLLFGISLLVNGIDVWLFYFTDVLSRANKGEIAGEFVQNYQSLFMFLKGLFASSPLLFSGILLLCKLILLAVGYFITKGETSKIKVFSLWIFLSILISPYGSTYGMILLIFLFFMLVNKAGLSGKSLAAVLLFFLVANIPVHYFSNLSIPFSFPRLILMFILFILLFRYSFAYVRWKRSVIFITPILILSFFFQRSKADTVSEPLFNSNTPILTYDYKIVDGALHYIYWDENGSAIESTDITIRTIDSITVQLDENQLFYKGKQITFGNDNKRKPLLINDTNLLYLSDLKTGIGFYQLRKIELD